MKSIKKFTPEIAWEQALVIFQSTRTNFEGECGGAFIEEAIREAESNSKKVESRECIKGCQAELKNLKGEIKPIRSISVESKRFSAVFVDREYKNLPERTKALVNDSLRAFPDLAKVYTPEKLWKEIESAIDDNGPNVLTLEEMIHIFKPKFEVTDYQLLTKNQQLIIKKLMEHFGWEQMVRTKLNEKFAERDLEENPLTEVEKTEILKIIFEKAPEELKVEIKAYVERLDEEVSTLLRDVFMVLGIGFGGASFFVKNIVEYAGLLAATTLSGGMATKNHKKIQKERNERSLKNF